MSLLRSTEPPTPRSRPPTRWAPPSPGRTPPGTGSGSKLYDVSGREYIDYLMGSGPLILGHAHPAVVAAVRDALEHGTTYFLVNEPIVRLADELCRAVPCAEQVRFTSTGTEATFFALRAARAFRGRDKIMKFEGGYHGGHDYALMSAAPRSPKAFPAATADSARERVEVSVDDVASQMMSKKVK